MQVSLIDNISDFDNLKNVWEKVYNADPHTHIFNSWSWLRGWFEVTDRPWFVIAVQSEIDSEYVAFLPLAIHSIQLQGLNVYRLLYTAGDFLADHTGFVCLPGHEAEAMFHLASYIQEHLQWDYLRMKEFLDPRLHLFLQYFERQEFTVTSSQGEAFSYLELPNSWEDYLQNFLSTKTRKNLRSALKKIETNRNFQIVETEADNLENQIAALLSLMQMQRGKQPEYLLDIYRTIFHRCAENNHLWLSILWENSTPIAATGIFLDQHNRACYGTMTGYNPDYSKLSPGRVMMAFSIKKAIEKNLQIYDFLRGSENYKSSLFGTQNKFNTDVEITRNNLKVNGIKVVKQIKDLISRS